MQAAAHQLDLPASPAHRAEIQDPRPFAGVDEPLAVQPDGHPGRLIGGGDDRELDLQRGGVGMHPAVDPDRFDDPGRRRGGRRGPVGRRPGAVDGVDLQVGALDLLEQRIQVGRGVQDHEVGGSPRIRGRRGVVDRGRRGRGRGTCHRGRRGDRRSRQKARQSPLEMPEEIQRPAPSRMADPGRDSDGIHGGSRPSPASLDTVAEDLVSNPRRAIHRRVSLAGDGLPSTIPWAASVLHFRDARASAVPRKRGTVAELRLVRRRRPCIMYHPTTIRPAVSSRTSHPAQNDPETRDRWALSRGSWLVFSS